MQDKKQELEAFFKRFIDEDWDEVDALAHLLDIGYTLDDFKYDMDRYNWARECGEKHGLF